MRILMLSQFYPPIIGGEERHVVNLSKGLAARGHQVHVACLPHSQRTRSDEQGSVTIHNVSGLMQRNRGLFSESERRHAPPFPDPEIALNLARLVDELNPDIVHSHNWLARSFLPLTMRSRARFIVTLHDYSLICAKKNLLWKGAACAGPSFSKCLSCASRHFGTAVGAVTCLGNWATAAIERKCVDRYIAVSDAVARYCDLPNGSAPYDVLPTFIPDDVGDISSTQHPLAAALPSDGYILFVGDLTRAKGIHVLLDAYRRLSNPPPLVLIGRRCADTPTELPQNTMLFESWPHEGVMQAWSRCTFGVAPSVWAEACGTIVMEANAVGKTMIGTTGGGLADLIDNRATGLLVAPGDASALAEAMSELIAEPGRRDAWGAASRRHVERFMAKSIIPRIEKIYEQAASHKQADSAVVDTAAFVGERRA